MTMRCTRCRKPFNQTGNLRRCPACIAYYREYYKANKEAEIARHAEWAAKNVAYLAAYQQQRRRKPHVAPVERERERKRGHTKARRGLRAANWRKWHLSQKYGLTLDDYRTMVDSQSGLCAICGDQPKILHVDHSHVTGRVRALICGHCNRGLGCFRDDHRRLSQAIIYLLTWQGIPVERYEAAK